MPLVVHNILLLSTFPSHIDVLSERGHSDASVADDRPGYPVPVAVSLDVIHVSVQFCTKYATSSELGRMTKEAEGQVTSGSLL